MDKESCSPAYLAGVMEGRDLLARWRGKDIGAASMAAELMAKARTSEGDRLAGFLAAVAAYTWDVMHFGEPSCLNEWDPMEDLAPQLEPV